MPERIIFHVDVNSAFLSWTAVKRLQDGETLDLRTVPSAVGGDVKSRRGIITAKSIPAKKFGIITGEPVTDALKKCPQLILVSGDFHLYHKCSEAFMKICADFSPKIEKFSIDECFMDMSEPLRGASEEEIYNKGLELGRRIRDELGFTVNIGISENKLLAKMASDFQKPDRVHTLWAYEIPKKFWPLPAEDLLYVGKSTVEKLRNIGIRTIGDIAHMDESILKAHLGDKGGHALALSSKGEDPSEVHDEREDAKSYGNSTTLPADITDEEDAYPVLLYLCDTSSRRMRKDGKKTSVITVHYKSSEFRTFSRQRKLDYHTDSTDVIHQEARKLFDELWDGHTPIRLLGVSCSGLSDGKNEQLTLFGNEDREKREALDHMLDEIRNKHGKTAVVRGSFLDK